MLNKTEQHDLTSRLRNDNIIIINASYELQQFLNYYSYHVYNLAQVIVANISNAINSNNHTTKIIGIPENHDSNEWHEWHGHMLHLTNSIGDKPQFYPTPFYMADSKFTRLCNIAYPTYTKQLNQLIQHICYYLANLTKDDTLTIDDQMAHDMILKSGNIHVEDPQTKWINTDEDYLRTIEPIHQQYDAETNTISPRPIVQIIELQKIINKRMKKS